MAETSIEASAEAPMIVTVTQSRGFGWALATFIQSIASLVLRLALALPLFWMGLPWWRGFLKLVPDATAMVQSEFPVHVGRFTYALPNPDMAGWVIGFVLILCPAAVAIGFLTRLAALVIFAFAILMCFVHPEGWIQHQLPAVAMALALLAYGPGEISFDYLIWRGFRRR